MAKTDAWGATGGSFHARRTAASRARAGLMGNARLIAEPAYQRLLAAEPVLRRAIPVLIVVFLAVIAGARGLSLMNDRDDIERQAKGMLALAAGQLSHAVALAPAPGKAQEGESQEDGAQEGGADAEAWNAVLSEIAATGALDRAHVLLVTDGDMTVRAATPSGAKWRGLALETFIAGGQPLILFGARAGVMEVTVAGQPWLAAASLADGSQGAAVAMIARDAVFADWRDTATFNITLFVATAAVLLIVAASAILGQVLANELIPQKLAILLGDAASSQAMLFLLINVLLLICGMFLQAPAAIIVIIPILMPIVTAFGIDPVHFGIVTCVNLAIGQQTPPVATVLMAVCSITKTRMRDTVPYMIWYLLAMFVVLVVVTYVPLFAPGLIPGL